MRPFGKDGRFGTLSKANFEPLQDGVERWIGLEGMGGIVRMLAEGLDIQQARSLTGFQPPASQSAGCLGAAVQRLAVLSQRRALGNHSAPVASVAHVDPSCVVIRNFKCSRLEVPGPGPQGREVKWFDAAVIAHNGKCAERLTSSTPAQEAASPSQRANGVLVLMILLLLSYIYIYIYIYII